MPSTHKIASDDVDNKLTVNLHLPLQYQTVFGDGYEGLSRGYSRN